MTVQPAQSARIQNRTDLWNRAARTIRANVLAENITPGDILDLAIWLDTGQAPAATLRATGASNTRG